MNDNTKAPWYAVQTHRGEETRAEGNLRAQGYVVWTPALKVMKAKTRRMGEIAMIERAFPGIVLASVPPGRHWGPIKSTPGVKDMMPAGRDPIAIRQAEMTTLFELFAADGIYDATPKPIETPDIGEQVTLSAGILAGRAGTVEEIRGELIKILLSGVDGGISVVASARNIARAPLAAALVR